MLAKGKDPLAFRATGLFMLVTNVLSQIINYHWFGLILKQVYRNLAKALGYELKGGDDDL